MLLKHLEHPCGDKPAVSILFFIAWFVSNHQKSKEIWVWSALVDTGSQLSITNENLSAHKELLD